MNGYLINRMRALGDVNWALADQAVVSGSNFLTTILVARIAGINEFGRFMVAWLIILLFKDLQAAIIESPMMSIGPKQPKDSEADYYGAVLTQQISFAVISFFLIWGGALVAEAIYTEFDFADLHLALAAAIFADQLQDFVRRYFYTNNRPAAAFANDAICYCCRILALFALWHFASANSADVLWILFACAMGAAGIGAFLFGPMRFNWSWLGAIAQRHWHFSKWTVGTSIMRWLAGNLIVLMGGAVLGAQAVGAVRAATNVLAPRNVLILGLSNIIVVKSAQIFHSHGVAELRAYLLKITLYMLAFEVTVAALAIIFAKELMGLLYGPDFEPYAYLIYWLAGMHMIQFFALPISTGLKVFEYTRPFFIAASIEAIFSVLTSHSLAASFGLPGVMIGLITTTSIMVLCLVGPFFKRIKG